MSRGTVLALLTGRPGTRDLTEWLRVVAAAAASGWDVRVLETGRGRGVLADPALPAEAERYLEGLESLEIRPVAASPDVLRAALREARLLLRLGEPTRTRTPPVLQVTEAWLETTPSDDLEEVLGTAGQILPFRPS